MENTIWTKGIGKLYDFLYERKKLCAIPQNLNSPSKETLEIGRDRVVQMCAKKLEERAEKFPKCKFMLLCCEKLAKKEGLQNLGAEFDIAEFRNDTAYIMKEVFIKDYNVKLPPYTPSEGKATILSKESKQSEIRTAWNQQFGFLIRTLNFDALAEEFIQTNIENHKRAESPK